MMHPDAQAFLDMLRASGRPPTETLSPDEARAASVAGRPWVQRPPVAVAEVRDVTIRGPQGPLRLRLYRGAGTVETGAGLPCLVYLHGGGWVLGDLDSHDGVCRKLANWAGCRVVAVDYRLAPEHVFPAALEDSAAAVAWIAANAASLGIDAARIALGGDSAGGNLAAVLALMSRDGTAPAACFQMLLYPATDLTMGAASYARMRSGLPLTAKTVRWFVDHYVPDVARRTDWRVSPLRAASLAGTPPAFVLTVGHDPLVDEGKVYAARLEAEGVRVMSLHLSGQIHGMVTMDRVMKDSDMVLASAAAALLDAWRA